MTAGRRSLPTLALPLLVLTSTACAATTYQESDTSGPSSPGSGSVVVEGAAPTVVAGTAAELLPQLADEAAGLSQLMIAGGDDEASAGRIDALWQAVRREVSAARPELVADFDANVRRCEAAVRFRRAADADKAASNLRALVTAFLAST